jgi:hypothetical protein
MGLALRGPELSSRETTKHDFDLARDLDLPISIHCGLAGYADRYRTAETLHGLGLLGPDVNYAHANLLTDDEYRLIAASGGSISPCPSIDMLMAIGTYPATGRALEHRHRRRRSASHGTRTVGPARLASLRNGCCFARKRGAWLVFKPLLRFVLCESASTPARAAASVCGCREMGAAVRRRREPLVMAVSFIGCDRELVLLVPSSLRGWVPEDHLVWTVLDAVAEMDLGAFYASYRADGHGRPAYEPSMMVALLLYAYARGSRSSRAVERACVEDVAYGVVAAKPGS